ncbi:hypothetical protein IMCC9480_3390 [Oxalobacteraceae bacterium IMCC9480]|nr:hypothetical protein IMCC9480_3390 [Oxalobacteraceae bacterium IMCC9480]
MPAHVDLSALPIRKIYLGNLIFDQLSSLQSVKQMQFRQYLQKIT